MNGDTNEDGKLTGLAGVLGFFIPAEVLSSVLLVFTMENIFTYLFEAFIPAGFEAVGWIAVYGFAIAVLAGFNYLSATDEELEELSDDFDDVT